MHIEIEYKVNGNAQQQYNTMKNHCLSTTEVQDKHQYNKTQ